MALHSDGGQASNYDDFLKKLSGETSKSIDDAVAASKEFADEANRNHYMRDIIQPHHDILYDTFISKLKAEFGADAKAKVSGDKKKVEKVLRESLWAYAEKTRPEVIESIKELGLSDEDTLDKLIEMYDSMHGVDPHNPVSQDGGPTTIRVILEAAKRGNATTGRLSSAMLQRRANDPGNYFQHLLGKYHEHHTGKFEKHQLMKHAYHKVKDAGLHDITDKTGFVKLGKQDYLNLVKAINFKDYEGVKLEQYGLDLKKQEAHG